MKPTNRLRWYQKSCMCIDCVLQQWWEHEDNGWLQPPGEWRDILVEVGDE